MVPVLVIMMVLVPVLVVVMVLVLVTNSHMITNNNKEAKHANRTLTSDC
jgi:hypothetical protein